MNDFERRLRAAMSAAVGSPPPGLIQGIRRRHRRHVIRVIAGLTLAAAVLALAAPPAAHALRSALSGPGHAAGPASGSSCPTKLPAYIGCARYVGPGGVASPMACPEFCPPPVSSARAAPGTMLRDCQSANDGAQEIVGYRPRSVRAGPVSFVWSRTQRKIWGPGKPLGNGQLSAGAGPVAVEAGATAVVRVAPAARSRFQFLGTFKDTGRYRIHAGPDGITFAACPASYLGPVTVFWVGYLDNGLSCIPLEVSVPGRRPVRVGLSAHGGTCAA